MMKKLAIAFGSLIFLILAAIIVIPFVIDVDKYRPEVEHAVNDHINGKFELGKLSLSLWGQIRIEVAGVSLKDAKGRSIVAVKDAFFHVPFESVFSGSPVLTFKMVNPAVDVVKDKGGKMNVLALRKEAPKGAPAAGGGAAAPTPVPGGKAAAVTLPAIATQARLGIELKNASVNYKDDGTGMTTQIKDLNFLVHDISLSRPITMELWADLDTKMGAKMHVKGPARMRARIEPKLSGMEFERATLAANVDLNDLEIRMPGLFEKHKGIPANAEGNFLVSLKEAKIERLDIKFHNAEIKIAGAVSNLGAPAAPGAPPVAPVIKMDVRSNEIALKPWVELVPMLKEFDLGGTTALHAEASGPADKLGYKAELSVKALTAKAPKLKAQPRIDGEIKVVTDQLEKLAFTMKAPGNEISINGKVVSFTQPRADFQISSPGMDLDQLIEFPPPKPKAAEGAEPAKAAGASGGGETGVAVPKGPPADLDASVASVRENKMLAGVVANLAFNLKFLKAYNIKMSDIEGKVFFKDLTAGIEGFQMGIWGGKLKSSGTVVMTQKTPTYRFNMGVDSLDIQQAVSSQFALFKNTLVGRMSFTMEGQGASFNTEPAMQNLVAKGSLKVLKAQFATVDAGKMASEAVNKAIERIGEKIPQAKGKSLPVYGGESRYEVIGGDFGIANGKFSAPNFLAKAEPNQGIDIRGETTVGLKDYALKTTWTIIDTYNLTKARDLSVEQNGIRVEHILAEGDKPVQFPVSAGCTAMKPCYSYTQVPEYLAGIALANVGRAVEGRAKEELRKKAEELAKKVPVPQLPPQTQEKAKEKVEDIKKKLFGG